MPSWAPSIIPDAAGHTFYLVIERNGPAGYFPETALNRTELEDVVEDLAGGQYAEPMEVVAFNPTEGWSRNVTEDIATELQHRADRRGDELTHGIVEFVARNTRHKRQLTLRLV